MNRLLFLVLIKVILVTSCVREPTPFHSRFPKLPGDNGFKIMISGDPDKYVPDEVYTVFLMGSRSFENVQHFSRFILNIESNDDPNNLSPQKVGSFQLYRDSLSKFNEDCVNTVSEVNDLQKTEVYVMWTAPPAGSGCVTFRAMVLQNSRYWYADEGKLSKTLCEQTSRDVKFDPEDCCACDEAKYNVIFEGLWSNVTHPKDFPTSLWLTHFSDLIGASHVRNFSFWGENHVASDGFRSLAEWGSPRLLESELKVQSKFLKNIIKTPGLWYPNVNSNASASFRVDRKRNLVSLASMFGPSPDWVVGVNGLNLCLKDCSWAEQITVDLYPWDAGTDSGLSYMSPNAETIPREKMYRITTTYPEDPRAPFYNPSKTEMLPLAKLYFTREKLIAKSCDEDFLASQLELEAGDNDDDVRTECTTTAYSDWTPCSVTCGKGLRMRTRKYASPQAAQTADCKRQLVFKEMCVAAIAECEGQSHIDDSNELIEDTEGICKTTEWTAWTECSVTCDVGFTMRTRRFLDRMGRKKCIHVSLVEKDKCMGPPCVEGDLDVPDPMCPVTEWSDWSPCSATCGNGIKIRTRFLLVEPELQQKCGSRVETVQQRPCSEKTDCTITMEIAKEICMQDSDFGPCKSYFNRWFYNASLGTCQTFVYGGCRGNKNNFLSVEECNKVCGFIGGNSAPVSVSLHQDGLHADEVIDCMVTPWSEWSTCSVTCGTGISQRQRMIKREAQNGGIPCPKRLIKRRKCSGPPCHQ